MADFTFEDLLDFEEGKDEDAEEDKDVEVNKDVTNDSENEEVDDGEKEDKETEEASETEPEKDDGDDTVALDAMRADRDALRKQIENMQREPEAKSVDDKAVDDFLKSLDDEDDETPITRKEFNSIKKSLEEQREWTSSRDQERATNAMNAEVVKIRDEFPEMTEKAILLSFVKGIDPREVAEGLRESFKLAGYTKSVDKQNDKVEQESTPAPLSAPPKTTPSSARKQKKKTEPKEIKTWDDLLDS